MTFLFVLCGIFILIYLPSLLLHWLLVYISNNHILNLTFESNGFLKYSNINFCIDNDFMFFCVHIDSFQIYLIWLRLRINPSGVRITFNLKTSHSTLVKTKPISKKLYSDSFVISRTSNKNNKSNKGFLSCLKEEFFQIIEEKYLSKHTNISITNKNNNEDGHEEDMIDNIIKKSDITRKDKFIRNIIVMFDLLLENIEVNFKLSHSDFYHSFFIRKSVIGAIKGLNKHKEVHVMVLAYDLTVKEYISVNNVKFRKSFGWKEKENDYLRSSSGLVNNPFEANGHTFDSYAEFLILSNKKLFFNAKLEYGLFPVNNLSLANTLNIKVELSHMNIDFSVRVINTIIKLVNEITKYNHYKEYKTSTEGVGLQSQSNPNHEITFRIECVEENLLQFIASQIKKIKVRLHDVDVRILSDNHTYIYTGLHMNNVQYITMNYFNYAYDTHKVKLLRTTTEVKVNDLLLTASRKERIILEVPSYVFTINKEMIYYHTIREAQVKSILTSDLPNISVIMTTTELDKFVEIFVVLICGLEKIEAYNLRGYYQTKYSEDMHEETGISIRFDNVSMIVHDEIIQGELSNLSLIVKLEEKKLKKSKVDVIFSPVFINVFRKFSSKYASNCIVKGFKLTINDDLITSHIDVLFEETKVLIYDDHLTDILKFVADFLTYNLRYSVKRKYKQQIQQEEIKLNPDRKDTTFLQFKRVIVYKVVDLKDMFTIKVNDFQYQIDEWMDMPHVRIYHQSLTNQLLKRRNLGMDIVRFHIVFHPSINELEINFGPIQFNVYCFELMHPVMTMFTFYHFFPLWIIYHMNYKYRVDEDYKLIYIAEFAKKDKVSIKFEEVIININQNPIANVGILQINPSMQEMFAKNPVKMLKDKKCEQMQIRVKNFTMATHGFYQKEINKSLIKKRPKGKRKKRIEEGFKSHNSNNDHDYYKDDCDYDDSYATYFDSKKQLVIEQHTRPYYLKLSKKGRLEMVYEQLDIYQETSKVVELSNFIIILGDTTVYDQFDLQRLNTISLTYKMHNIFYKEVKSRKVKHGYIEIYMDNMKVYLDDIKIIDKIALFTKKLTECALAYDIRDNSLDEIVDEAKIELHDTITIGMNNFKTVVNSLDPITGEIFNKLYLNLECLVMGKENGPGYDRLQLSVYYLTFGFNYLQNNEYPMLILPIGEFSVDLNTLRVNVPSNCLRRIAKNSIATKTQLITINTSNDNNEDSCSIKNQGNNDIWRNDSVKMNMSKIDQFIMNTQSFSLFMNYAYLSTFSKIFENFWMRSEFVRKYLFSNNNSTNVKKNDDKEQSNKKRKHKKRDHDNSRLSMSQLKMQSNHNRTLNLSDQEYSLNSHRDKTKEKFNSNSNPNGMRLFLTVFDLKIIYLLNYKPEFDSVFQFHKEIKLRGYFGYVIRLYSTSLKYAVSTIDNEKVDELKINFNLFTISVLNQENMNDDKFFKLDGDIKLNKFTNLKIQSNFNDFMELTNRNNLLINDVLMPAFECNEDIYRNSSSLNFISGDIPFADLPFNFQNTLIKIFEVSFKRDTLDIERLEEIYVNLKEIKVTWNKMNMDMLGILIFEDILQIVDKILLKVGPNNNNKKESDGNTTGQHQQHQQQIQHYHSLGSSLNSNANVSHSINNNTQMTTAKNTFDLGRFNFIFELISLQVCIENEIKKSKVLLTTKSKSVLKLSKLCLNQNFKDFKLELSVKDMMVYIPPNFMTFDNNTIPMSNVIYWIGDRHDNKFYLDTKLFNQMVSIPNITFTLEDHIKNTINENGDNIEVFNRIDIIVDRLIGDFAHSYFENFMNIIEVFIFNRGNTMAEEKVSMDSRDNDLKIFKLTEIKKKIKDKINVPSKIRTKQISFTLKDVTMTLLKENKEIIKLLMRKFEGDHIILKDKSSETNINVSILKILDLLKIKNDMILSQTNENKFGLYENKIEMIRFRKKDSYISIGTASKWYVLDYLEIGIQPLFINITKYHCDFILEFFFNTTSKENKLTEEEYKNILISSGTNSGKFSEEDDINSIIPTNTITKNNKGTTSTTTAIAPAKDKEDVEGVQYPVYFKHVKINETMLNVSFFFSDNSPWNLKEAKVKFTEFEKKDKFYASNILIYRIIHHMKMIGLQNVGNVLASMLFDRSDNTNKKKEDEEAHKELIFGKLYKKK